LNILIGITAVINTEKYLFIYDFINMSLSSLGFDNGIFSLYDL